MLGLCTGAHAVALCVCEHRHASSCLLLPPKENRLQTEQGLGEAALEALTVGFPLLMFFLLVFCLLGILPVLYMCIYVIYCCLLIAVFMLHPLLCKAPEQGGIVVFGFSELLRF